MTIYEWAKQNDRLGDEITVWDTTIDTEFYAYPDDEESDDLFEQCCQRLWRFIEVEEDTFDDNPDAGDGIYVNLAKVIAPARRALANEELFWFNDTNSIIEDFPNIVSGYVDELWMEKFTDIVTGRK